MSPAVHLFSYGTLQLPEVQLATFGREVNGVPDSIVGHELVDLTITDAAVIAASGAATHPMLRRTGHDADRVDGTVFMINEKDLAAADAYEVDDYARVKVRLASGLDAWVYVDRLQGESLPERRDAEELIGSVPVRAALRAIPVFATALPKFETARLPDSPGFLFVEWLAAAIDAGEVEPHAMTLSTVDAEGRADARMLILKDVRDDAWAFASSNLSPKGRQLEATPAAALTFYWPKLGRQVRVRGDVIRADPDESAADFLARPIGAQEEAWLARQSLPLSAGSNLTPARRSEGAVAPNWTVYWVQAAEVEFFQGTESRDHTRVRYQRATAGWVCEQLWA